MLLLWRSPTPLIPSKTPEAASSGSPSSSDCSPLPPGCSWSLPWSLEPSEDVASGCEASSSLLELRPKLAPAGDAGSLCAACCV